MKTLLLSFVLMCLCVSEADAQVFEYVRIEYTALGFLVSSTTSEFRVVEFSVEKGEQPIVTRTLASRAKAFFDLVREYEEQGWELFTVWSAPNEAWIMRKPKQ